MLIISLITFLGLAIRIDGESWSIFHVCLMLSSSVLGDVVSDPSFRLFRPNTRLMYGCDPTPIAGDTGASMAFR